jgi:predicted RNA-binding protein with PUA-like domain
MASYWLLKTEPGEYSYADLERDQRAEWDGVTNPTAQRNMRQIAVGDVCVVYHTGDERQAVGLARVVRAGYPDPADASGKRVLVDIAPAGQLGRAVGLAEIKAMPLFADSPLVRIGRLSVFPLTAEQFAALDAASGRSPAASPLAPP